MFITNQSNKMVSIPAKDRTQKKSHRQSRTASDSFHFVDVQLLSFLDCSHLGGAIKKRPPKKKIRKQDAAHQQTNDAGNFLVRNHFFHERSSRLHIDAFAVQTTRNACKPRFQGIPFEHISKDLLLPLNCIAYKFRHRGTVPQIHTESGPRKNFHSMTHHGHFVKRRLSIEDNDVVIIDMTFNLSNLIPM